tara:strand:- start:3922 stop:4308 length:387 start_codon:yes stop_codon:yes gene_type:complete
MGLFNRLKNLFTNNSTAVESEDEEQDTNQQEYASKYHGNSEKLSTEAMDTLLLEDPEEAESDERVIVSEYDAGDVGFEEFESTDLEDNSDKNVVVHDSYENLDEYLEGAEIIGDIPREVSFDPGESKS